MATTLVQWNPRCPDFQIIIILEWSAVYGTKGALGDSAPLVLLLAVVVVGGVVTVVLLGVLLSEWVPQV
jgi:hypothetical protein